MFSSLCSSLHTTVGRIVAQAGLTLILLSTVYAAPQQEVFARAPVIMDVTVRAGTRNDTISLAWHLKGITDNNSLPSTNTYFEILRRKFSESSFQSLGSTLGKTGTFDDTTSLPGELYEYQVKYVGTPYISSSETFTLAGRNVPPLEQRGRLLVVLSRDMTAALADELAVFQSDLVTEGWNVDFIEVDKAPRVDQPGWKEAVQKTKDSIQSRFNAPNAPTSLLLIGNVAVPYSGLGAPDGHDEHSGAWAMDAYYADTNGGKWGDSGTATRTHASRRTDTDNRPNDGKFDVLQEGGESITAPDVPYGRIYFANMPYFISNGQSEIDLYKSYFQRDHAFRTGSTEVTFKASTYDQFLTDNILLYASRQATQNFPQVVGYRNFELLAENEPGFRTDINTSWIKRMLSVGEKPYLLTYVAGGGSYTLAHGIAQSTTLAEFPPQAIFNFAYGSFFGDWDSQGIVNFRDINNNFLRGFIAKRGLISAWISPGGKLPTHLMARDQTIGEVVLAYQQGGHPLYDPRGRVRRTHQIMGDPTLTTFQLPAEISVTGYHTDQTAIITWNAIPNTTNYHVYRAPLLNGPYTKIVSLDSSSLGYVDSDPAPFYMVRAEKVVQRTGLKDLRVLSRGGIAFVAPLTQPNGLFESVVAVNSDVANPSLSAGPDGLIDVCYKLKGGTDPALFSRIDAYPRGSGHFTYGSGAAPRGWAIAQYSTPNAQYFCHYVHASFDPAGGINAVTLKGTYNGTSFEQDVSVTTTIDKDIPIPGNSLIAAGLFESVVQGQYDVAKANYTTGADGYADVCYTLKAGVDPAKFGEFDSRPLSGGLFTYVPTGVSSRGWGIARTQSSTQDLFCHFVHAEYNPSTGPITEVNLSGTYDGRLFTQTVRVTSLIRKDAQTLSAPFIAAEQLAVDVAKADFAVGADGFRDVCYQLAPWVDSTKLTLVQSAPVGSGLFHYTAPGTPLPSPRGWGIAKYTAGNGAQYLCHYVHTNMGPNSISRIDLSGTYNGTPFGQSLNVLTDIRKDSRM